MIRWLLMAAVVVWAYCGCASHATTAAAYGTELQACVHNASTKSQSQACRCAVSTRYGRACDDAGAP